MVRNGFILALASALLFCSLGATQATAAPQAATRDPQALTLIASSLQALTGGVAITDVTLQASAAYVAGSDEESGTATLIASGNQQSLVTLGLTGGQRQEIRNGPAGAWSGPDGTVQAMATHNCWTDASWFFPTLTLEAISSNPQIAVSYLGSDTAKGRPLLHVQVGQVVAGQDPGMAAWILALSAMDLYLDPQSFLPQVLDFKLHPDTDANRSIPVEIQFGNFQKVSGGLVPFSIQKYIQGTLTLNFAVTNVAVNSGVPQSDFAVPPTTGGQS
jgi:hypothetical protein